MSNSYKRLQRRLAYSEQRAAELQKVIAALDDELHRLGVTVRVPLSCRGVSGDQFLTDVNMGDMDMQLSNIHGLTLMPTMRAARE